MISRFSMNDSQDLLCSAFAIVSATSVILMAMIYGPSLLLLFALIIVLLIAYNMWLRLKLADALEAPPRPFDVLARPQPPPTQDPTEKAVSETRNVLHHLIPDEGYREVMTDDVARLAEECGHHEFARKLRATF